MDNVQFLVLAGLGCVSIILAAVLLFKIKNVTYLLEQPVVKKMSPALKLKPVKVDEIDDANRRAPERSAPNGIPVNRNNGRPPMERPEGGDRGPREQSRDRAPRAEREGGDRGPRGDRGGERGDRFGGGRDRGDRGGRHDRHGGDRDRNRGPRPDVFTNERSPEGAAAAPAADGVPMSRPPLREEPRFRPEAPRRDESPVNNEMGALAPRRPLPSTVDHEPEQKEFNAPEALAVNSAMNDASVSDPMFGQTDSDIQHGRRNQLKKKPRFEIADEGAKEPTEESKA